MGRGRGTRPEQSLAKGTDDGSGLPTSVSLHPAPDADGETPPTGLSRNDLADTTVPDAYRPSRDQLDDMIAQNRLWSESGGEEGIRAILRGADLRGMNLEDEDLSGADLSQAKLAHAVLRGAHLQWADLRGAELEDADLEGANLQHTCLSDANLVGAFLYGADLELANLTGADLQGADLTDASLDYACLRGAKLSGTDFTGASLAHVAWPEGFNPPAGRLKGEPADNINALRSRDTPSAPATSPQPYWQKEVQALLPEIKGLMPWQIPVSWLKKVYAIIPGMDRHGSGRPLRPADLKAIPSPWLRETLIEHVLWKATGGARGKLADLRGTDLTAYGLQGLWLVDANLAGANLANAVLENTMLNDADLRGANLEGANLQYADLTGADLRGANLRGADLTGASLYNAMLHGADLTAADLTNANLEAEDDDYGFKTVIRPEGFGDMKDPMVWAARERWLSGQQKNH